MPTPIRIREATTADLLALRGQLSPQGLSLPVDRDAAIFGRTLNYPFYRHYVAIRHGYRYVVTTTSEA